MLEAQSEDSVLLYAVSTDGIVYPFAEDRTFRAGPGWRIAHLNHPDRAAKDGQEMTAAERARAHLGADLPKPLPK